MKTKFIFHSFILFFICNIFSAFIINAENKKAVVIGATSGMGRQTAKIIAKNGYDVGLVGRRIELLQSLQKEIPTKTYIKQIDVTQDNATELLEELIVEMEGIDLILIAISSYNDTHFEDTKEAQQKIIDVDLLGFHKMAEFALGHFRKQKSGHLVGISSFEGLRGNAKGPIYSATKAFISRYLEGIRNEMIQKNISIYVTDIIPGWVDTEDTTLSKLPPTYWSKFPHTFWVATTQDAAVQIYDAIKKKKKKAYITKRQIIIAWLLKHMPDWLYNKLGGF
jgi:short-subunit dehydrogenase